MVTGTLAILIAAVSLSTGGQLLLRSGMVDVGSIDAISLSSLVQLLKSVLLVPKLLLGLCAFGISSVFWLVALSRVPLSTANPMVSLSYVLIFAFSYIVLGERPSPAVWSGVALIAVGISLVGLGQSQVT